MADKVISPLRHEVPIVQPDSGRPTPQFIRLFQLLFEGTTAKGGDAVPTSRSVKAGTGLSGGGDLSANRTISLNANISDLNNVDAGSPSDGQALVFDNASGTWKPQGVATAFLGLTDTPGSYSGAAGQAVAVKSDESGVEFVSFPSAPVASVFGRTGAVTAQSGDYTAAQITETASAKIMTGSERTKLAGIESGAEVNDVTSVFGRTGGVTAQSGDYSVGQVTGALSHQQIMARASLGV